MRASRPLLILLAALLVSSAAWGANTPDVAQIAESAVDAGASTWSKANELSDDLSSRELFSYAVALCEARMYPERLERVFTVAARMQDRDPESRGYGNFRWRWKEGAVLDFNAVEFCMQSALLLWVRHRDELPAAARTILAEILDYAVEGCLRHRVTSSYTNIALMNAGNLIVLGEALDKHEVADEGYRRLDQFCMYTWQAGIHEYDSPTYYGTDLDDLVFIESLCKRESGREQARALLQLFWTDIALNWFPPMQRLAGARSRDYDYLRGRGFLDVQMRVNGWLDEEGGYDASAILPALATWRPRDELKSLCAERFPRYVRQKWGVGASNARSHMLFEDVTLSSAGANYGQMDMPLTVDFPGPRDSVRCYFIPDARRDPYGKKRIPAGPHEKTLHLRPFFAATQRRVDALGLVIYRSGDYPENPATLESHFVMPADADGFWIGDEKIDVREPGVWPVPPEEPLFIRKGTAVAGIRLPWARGMDGVGAATALVVDGNEHGAVRLTVAHHNFWGMAAESSAAGAALWVRIGSGIDDGEDLEAWMWEFASAEAAVGETDTSLEVTVAGVEGPLTLACASPYRGCLNVDPPHTQAILELDGEDIGRPILQPLEIVQQVETHIERAPVVAVAPDKSTTWEAESGSALPPMTVGQDDGAFGLKYVWTPGAVGARGGGEGRLTWRLQIDKAGRYYLWGRVKTPTPEDDSFFVRVFTDKAELVERADWHTGTYEDWEWAAVRFGAVDEGSGLTLPEGDVMLELQTREDGAAIDQLFISADPNEKPN